MPTHGSETSYELRCAVITCRVLYESSFAEIERKTGVAQRTAEKLYQRAKFRAGCEDFNELLACVGDVERSGRPRRVPEGSKLSKDCREAMLKHSNLKPYTAVMDQENIEIPGQKRPSRSLLERVQYEHEHLNNQDEVMSELVRGRAAKKPRREAEDDEKRLEFCHFALKELKEGSIFICTDESYHEVGVKSGPENITRPKEADAENYSVPQESIEFTIMQ